MNIELKIIPFSILYLIIFVLFTAGLAMVNYEIYVDGMAYFSEIRYGLAILITVPVALIGMTVYMYRILIRGEPYAIIGSKMIEFCDPTRPNIDLSQIQSVDISESFMIGHIGAYRKNKKETIIIPLFLCKTDPHMIVSYVNTLLDPQISN